MTTETPATVEIEKWPRIRARTKSAESRRSRLRHPGSGTTSGVKRNFWPLRNFWPMIVFQVTCFSG